MEWASTREGERGNVISSRDNSMKETDSEVIFLDHKENWYSVFKKWDKWGHWKNIMDSIKWHTWPWQHHGKRLKGTHQENGKKILRFLWITLEILQKVHCEEWIWGHYFWRWEAKEMRVAEVELMKFWGDNVMG